MSKFITKLQKLNPNSSLPQVQFDFAREYLGPVICDYLFKLLLYASHFEKSRGAKILFVSRSGIRIYRALEVLASSLNRKLPNSDFFWISRLMVTKGVWLKQRSSSIKVFSKEFFYTPLYEVVKNICKSEAFLKKIDWDDPALDSSGSELESFLRQDTSSARFLEDYLNDQSSIFDEYLTKLVGFHKCILLVDTGWQGTAQRLLSSAYPKLDWWGAYFGRCGFHDSDREYWKKTIGLVFESDTFDPRKPETCTYLNRHIIEHLFEPEGSSIECMTRSENGSIVAPGVARILSDSPTKQSHPLFAGVLDYLSKIPSDSSPSGIRRKASDAWQEIARLIAFPTRDEVEIFSGVKRSANFGKDLLVPFCIPPSAILLGTQSTTESRVKDALWPSGQIAIEYPSEIVEPLQSKCSGLTSKRSLESFNSVNEHSSTLGLISQIPKVAVITRTLDRPMFLQRALESVNKQTFKDYIHVIVNDGGDTEIVKRVILESDQCDRTKVLLVNHATNRGMEAASNSGIKSCESKYITIHDDDDSWESEFLEKSVAFLEGEKGKVYSGVVAKSMYISETVKPQGIIVHKKFPYQGWIDTIHLTEMSIENFYPPIAFLFRRDIYTKIGGFNESYPVLGDWDFNLRYLMEADIGVIQEYLCNYHHRDTGGADTFKNSVISGVKTHSEYSAIVRNEFVRKTHAERTNLPVVGLGSYLAEQRSNLRAILRSTLSHDTP